VFVGVEVLVGVGVGVLVWVGVLERIGVDVGVSGAGSVGCPAGSVGLTSDVAVGVVVGV
jgi:hypothetical protein